MNEFYKRIEGIKNSIELPLVITHARCMDGTGSVLAIAKSLHVEPEDLQVIYHQYGDTNIEETIELCEHRNVIMCDFSFSLEQIEEINSLATLFVVIDHHKTAEAILGDLDYALFDMSESGATLSWLAFNPDAEPPRLLQYIKDRDIWEWKLQGSKEVSAGLELIDKRDINTFTQYLYDTSDLLVSGDSILKYQNQMIEKKTYPYKEKKPARYITYKDMTVPFINTTTLISEIGNELSKTHPFAIMFFITDDSIVLSMRSNDDNPEAVDVSEICAKFLGGGHVRASGCSFKFDEHPGILDQLFIAMELK